MIDNKDFKLIQNLTKTILKMLDAYKAENTRIQWLDIVALATYTNIISKDLYNKHVFEISSNKFDLKLINGTEKYFIKDIKENK